MSSHKKFRVRIYCGTCEDDAYGCEDSYIEDSSGEIAIFDTYEEAESTGAKETVGSVFEWDVEEEEE